MMPSSAMTPRMATKPNGAPTDQKCRRSTDDAERTGRQHQHRLAEMLQLDHQQHDDDGQHDRRLGGDRGLAFGRILGAALDLDLVAGARAVAQALHLAVHLHRRHRSTARRPAAWRARVMVGRRSRRHSTPCSSTGTTLATCDSGTKPPKSRRDIDRVDRRQQVPACLRLAGDDRNRLLAVAEIVERRARHGRLQHLADALRGDAERAGAILVDHQLHRRHRLQPVVVDGAEHADLPGTSPSPRRRCGAPPGDPGP